MKSFKIFVSLIFAVVLTFPAAPAAAAQADAAKIRGKFGYWSGSGQTAYETGRIVPFEYEDSYFEKSSDTYDHDLAKISLALSLASYDFGELEWLLGEIGFKQIEPNEYYLRSGDKTKTEADNIGVAIANKKIGDYTVVAAVVRGFEYGAEWAGNFNVGSDADFHAGFKKARDIVINEIGSYLDRNQIGGGIKIWLTGYSRGGAAANLAAGEILERQKFGAADVYAYCFEAPMGLKKSNEKDTGYSGIFNIVNPNDPVAKVPMADWGFCRYGTDIYLPSPESNGEYGKLSQKMKDFYREYRASYSDEPDRIDDFREWAYLKGQSYCFKSSPGAFADELFKSAAGLLDCEDYVKKAQQALVDSCADAYGLALDLEALIFSLPDTALQLAMLHPGALDTVTKNGGVFLLAHYPDLCLAWMYSLDSDYFDLCEPALPVVAILRFLVIS